MLIAAIVLLFTGRYPKPLYDFVMGMDRWALRVGAYAALMTDRYPPFRLDQGGTDPGWVPAGPIPPVALRGADRRAAGSGHRRAVSPWPPRDDAGPGAARPPASVHGGQDA